MLEHLYSAMKDKNVAMVDVADLLAVRYQTVSDKIHGTSSFSFNQAVKIRNEFFPEFSLEYLFQEIPQNNTAKSH